MASRSKSVTPRRYGDIIGSIFSNGSGELEEKKNCSVSQVKRKFRERRQKSSPGRSLSRNPTPERRQNTSSPTRQYNEIRSNSRPPTPDRRHFRSQNKDSSPRVLPRNNTLSFSQLEPFQFKSKGISARSLSLSPTKRRNRGVDSSESTETLTSRFAKQVSNEVKKTTEQVHKDADTIISKPSEQELEQMKNNQVSERNKERKRDTIRDIVAIIAQENESTQTIPILQGLPAKMGPEAGASLSYSQGGIQQMTDVIQAQYEQIKFYEICLKKQSNDSEQLSLELKLSKKNESKLDLELEIHDLKYSMYDDYRRMMDRQRLDNTYDKEGNEIERELESSLFSKSYDAFSKLDHLDRLYEKSKLEVESRFSILQEEYNMIISTRSLLVGETPMDNSYATSLNTVVASTNPTVISDLLKKRIKILESENHKYHVDIKRKEEELEKEKSLQSSSTSRKETNLLDAHNLEKQTLKNKIVALETEIGFTSGHIDDKTRTRRYRALEKNLNDYVAEIMGLEDQLKAKDKIISKLKERDLTLNFGSGKPNGLDSHLSMSSAKWYEQSNNGPKGSTMSSKPITGLRMPVDQLHGLDYASEPTTGGFEPNTKEAGKQIEGLKTTVGDNIDAVSTDVLELKSRLKKRIGDNKIGSRKSINRKGSSSSSARIAMLRKRLDALANDHSSICTEDTQFSSKTSP